VLSGFGEFGFMTIKISEVRSLECDDSPQVALADEFHYPHLLALPSMIIGRYTWNQKTNFDAKYTTSNGEGCSLVGALILHVQGSEFADVGEEINIMTETGSSSLHVHDIASLDVLGSDERGTVSCRIILKSGAARDIILQNNFRGPLAIAGRRDRCFFYAPLARLKCIEFVPPGSLEVAMPQNATSGPELAVHFEAIGNDRITGNRGARISIEGAALKRFIGFLVGLDVQIVPFSPLGKQPLSTPGVRVESTETHTIFHIDNGIANELNRLGISHKVLEKFEN
jgi:hypothetical protein